MCPGAIWCLTLYSCAILQLFLIQTMTNWAVTLIITTCQIWSPLIAPCVPKKHSSFRRTFPIAISVAEATLLLNNLAKLATLLPFSIRAGNCSLPVYLLWSSRYPSVSLYAQCKFSCYHEHRTLLALLIVSPDPMFWFELIDLRKAATLYFSIGAIQRSHPRCLLPRAE